ncbi:GTP-binding protein [uncultured Methanomethylovorans sp.]|uniref:GTP-binding protein n=1 Tax=uncultured Methanomethylovorans sp. TaxID=183759 RepID=UPI002AA9501A|nr:GTP-binding protein [uncultured Methanomethylovorans sp.]
MKILIISGFLGSGKTTSVVKIGKYLKDRGYTIAVLVNDVADVGVDGQVINENGLESKEMPRGCICCTLKYALEGNIALIQAESDPDILIIEPTGVAFPDRIKEQIEIMDFGPEVTMGPIISLIDGSQFKHIIEHSEYAATKQMENADFIVINKRDLMEQAEISAVENIVRNINPDADVFALSLKNTDREFMEFMSAVESRLGMEVQASSAVKEGDSDCPDNMCAANDDHFDHFNVSSYADTYHIEHSIDTETAISAATCVMKDLKSMVLALNPKFLGHLKMFLHTESIALRISVTSYLDNPEVEVIDTDISDHGEFTVFAAVTDVPRDNLAEIIKRSVMGNSCQLGIST